MSYVVMPDCGALGHLFQRACPRFLRRAYVLARIAASPALEGVGFVPGGVLARRDQDLQEGSVRDGAEEPQAGDGPEARRGRDRRHRADQAGDTVHQCRAPR
eukprot:9083664-Pyramimonas_sp.AAC.1